MVRLCDVYVHSECKTLTLPFTTSTDAMNYVSDESMNEPYNGPGVDIEQNIDTILDVHENTPTAQVDTLYIETNTSIDDETNAMSPTAVDPKAMHLTRSLRFKALTDACNSYVKAWTNHPRFHDKALGYIVNGTNAINGKEMDPGKSLESHAASFHTSFGSNTSGPMYLSGPRVAATRNTTGGRGNTNRLTSSVERASKRARQNYNEPKRSGTGSQSKCSFCHNIGHTRTTCTEKAKLGRDYTDNSSNLLHILTLPIHSVQTYKYGNIDCPKAVPNIPVEVSRLVILRIWVPDDNVSTTDDTRVFVTLNLFDNLLESVDDVGGMEYKARDVRDWIRIHTLQTKSKKFSVHLNLLPGDTTLDGPIKRMDETPLESTNETQPDDDGMIET